VLFVCEKRRNEVVERRFVTSQAFLCAVEAFRPACVGGHVKHRTSSVVRIRYPLLRGVALFLINVMRTRLQIFTNSFAEANISFVSAT